MSAEDFRIRPYDFFGGSTTGGDMTGVIVGSTSWLSETSFLKHAEALASWIAEHQHIVWNGTPDNGAVGDNAVVANTDAFENLNVGTD